MHIVFNALKTNLGNTGGCKTIVESAKTLRKLGHKVDIVASKNRYTWDNVKTIKEIPKCDACIAISCMDIGTTLNAKAGKKVFWKRGHEVWMMPKDKLLRKISKIETICNSTWQVEHLKKHGIKSKLCYSGLDLDLWKTGTTKSTKPTIGFLYHEKHKTKRWRECKKIMKIFGDKYEYKILGKDKFITGKKLVSFYSDCDIWFAPTVLEGFHNPPAEANLCGSLVVCSDNSRCGCHDYADRVTAEIYYSFDDAVNIFERLQYPDFDTMGKVAIMQDVLKNKIGSREVNMARLVRMLK